MVTINDLEKILKDKNLTEQEIEDFKFIVNPIYDFYNFMFEKYDMTYNDVDSDSKDFSTSVFPDYTENLYNDEGSIIQKMVDIISDIMKRYANKYDYDKSEELKKSMIKLMELQVSHTLQNNNTNE
jgi:hypothetical protein